MTLIEHYSQLFHAKYFYPTEENKDDEFFKTMNKHFAELVELEKEYKKKIQEKEEEINRVVESFDFNMGDIDYQDEYDYEETLEEVKVDGKKLKFGKKYGNPTKNQLFYSSSRYETGRYKLEDEIREKYEWYVKTFQIDEGWMELSVEEEFDVSKLVWDGECMKYGEEHLSDEGNTKPNSDVETTIDFDSKDDDVYCSYGHSWY